jgi:hypothetical protein
MAGKTPETVPYEEFNQLFTAHQKLVNETAEEREKKVAEIVEKEIMEITDRIKEDMEIHADSIKNATLFKKMTIVMAAVKRVPQNGWNSFHKYKYPTETDLLEAVREILAEAGLALMVTVVDSKRELLDVHDKYKPTDPDKTKKNWFTRIKMEFTLGCTDTGQTWTSRFDGEGGDNEDKGLYKAYTNTMKYFLRQTFLIPTGDVAPDSDGRPMDVEYNDPPQGYDTPKNQNGGKNTQNQKKPADGKPEGNKETTAITREQLIEKWKSIGGTKDNFTPFYDKQVKDGKNHAIINKFLDSKIADRKKMQADADKAAPDETSGK